MTTLTIQGAPVKPTSTEAEITHPAERRHQVAIGAVYRALTSDAAFHLPYVMAWRLGTLHDPCHPDLQGQLDANTEQDVVLAVSKWAEHLGAERIDQKPMGCGGRVECTAVMGDVRVQIWGAFDHPTDNGNEVPA